MFSVANSKQLGLIHEAAMVKAENLSVLVEGVQILDAISPVNNLTGTRENPLNLIGLIMDDTRKDLLSKLLADVPTIKSMASLPDDEMADLVAPRLATGIPAEDAAFNEHLFAVASAVMPEIRRAAGVQQPSSDGSQSEASSTAVEVSPE